jgi:formylglycine-generating enzyme required for sulfatase activity
MKTTIILILTMMVSITSYSQNHKNFTLVPQGNFGIIDSETPMSISIDNFWMSNEITNKEFRQFFNQIKNTPNDTIEWIDFSNMKKGGTSKPKIMKEANSLIFNKLMNESAWKSVFEKGDYFTNPKYDNYPVVGVTWEGAKYYCIWRSNVEKSKFKGQNKVVNMDYRLPTQYEWEYALTYSDSNANVDLKELHRVVTGDKNKLGLLNLSGNVSEWTSSSGSNDSLAYKVVKGSSWKSGSEVSQRELVMPHKGTDYIGFRIVQSDKR